MKYRFCCALCALLLSTPALACTPEEATAKAKQLAAKVAQITEQDPQRAARLNKEMQKDGAETQAKDLRNDCEAYDQRMRELEQIDQQNP